MQCVYEVSDRSCGGTEDMESTVLTMPSHLNIATKYGSVSVLPTLASFFAEPDPICVVSFVNLVCRCKLTYPDSRQETGSFKNMLLHDFT